MADYVAPIVCDASANFTTVAKTGTGDVLFNTTDEREGSACFGADVTSGAGTAYAEKTLTANVGLGDYVRIRCHFWYAREVDFATPNAPSVSGGIHAIQLHETGSGNTIMLQFVFFGTLRQRVICSIGPDLAYIPAATWTRGTWYRPVIYAYVHDTAGWLQIWDGGVLLGEVTGIDTYPGAAYDELRVGITWREQVADEIAFVYDYIEVDDTASPLPPASGYGSPLRRGIVCPHYHNQADARGQANATWPAVADMEWVH